LGASGKIQTLATNAADEGNNGFTLSTDTGSRPQFLLAESSTTKAQSTASTQMAVGTWYHVVGTFDDANDRARIYVNGSLERESSYTGRITYASSRDLLLGKQVKTYLQSSRFLQGSLDEVAVYGSELPAATVKEHYDAGRG